MLPYTYQENGNSQKCEINNDVRTYKVKDTKKENTTNYETGNSIKYEIEHFVDLEEIDNPRYKK